MDVPAAPAPVLPPPAAPPAVILPQILQLLSGRGQVYSRPPQQIPQQQWPQTPPPQQVPQYPPQYPQYPSQQWPQSAPQQQAPQYRPGTSDLGRDGPVPGSREPAGGSRVPSAGTSATRSLWGDITGDTVASLCSIEFGLRNAVAAVKRGFSTSRYSLTIAGPHRRRAVSAPASTATAQAQAIHPIPARMPLAINPFDDRLRRPVWSVLVAVGEVAVQVVRPIPSAPQMVAAVSPVAFIGRAARVGVSPFVTMRWTVAAGGNQTESDAPSPRPTPNVKLNRTTNSPTGSNGAAKPATKNTCATTADSSRPTRP